MGAVTATPLRRIRDPQAGRAYPRRVLRQSRTALILFAAGFLGRQDAYWAAVAHLHATCVDTDTERLEEMERMYPDGWEFVNTDAYQFARRTPDRWDVVSLDPWTQDFQTCANALPLWCALAERAVVLGTGVHTVAVAPDGWRITEVRRRTSHDGGVDWTVLEPE